MPYDPRMLQMAQRGVRMMGPEQRSAFADPRSQQPQQPKPPSLLDMMMGLGRMSRPEYDKAIQGPGSYGVSPKDAARVSPWAWLGGLGGGTPR